MAHAGSRPKDNQTLSSGMISTAQPSGRCSVVLCTYNGASFLAAQLESLVRQSRLPDELVIGDDGSTDSTLAILESFQDKAPFPVRIHRWNGLPLGPAANFARTLALAEGDMIALCDQDDIWREDKLVRLCAALMDEPDVTMAFSDAELLDEHLRPLGYTMWQRVELGIQELEVIAADDPMQVLLKRFRVTGATLIFATWLRPLILPLPPDWPHDAWIACIAAANGRLRAIPEPLLRYRQHGGNAVGGQRPSFWKLLRRGLSSDRQSYLLSELARHRELAVRLQSLPQQRFSRPAATAVAAKVRHLERRAALPAFPLARWPSVLNEWAAGGYRRWTTDWRSLALDLFLPDHRRP